jgi:hypothetical protein
VQHHDAADGEASDSSQGRNLQQAGLEAQHICADCRHSADQSQNIEPEGRMDLNADVPPQPELQQKCRESNGGHDHQSQRTQKRTAAGKGHHERKCEQQEAGREDRPSPGLVNRGRVGSAVRQTVQPKLYREEYGFFNWLDRVRVGYLVGSLLCASFTAVSSATAASTFTSGSTPVSAQPAVANGLIAFVSGMPIPK